MINAYKVGVGGIYHLCRITSSDFVWNRRGYPTVSFEIVIMQAKWVCPKCGSAIKSDTNTVTRHVWELI